MQLRHSDSPIRKITPGEPAKIQPGDLEGSGEKEKISRKYDDPFSNDEFAEVRYRTMSWW